MDGERAELLFTSPPYADMRDYKGGDFSVEKISSFIVAFSHCTEYQAVNLGIKREQGAIVPYWDTYIQRAKESQLLLLAWNVWSRHGYGGSIGNMTAMFPIEHEWVFVFGKKEKSTNKTSPNKHGGKSINATVRGKDGEMRIRDRVNVGLLGHLGSVYVSDVARGEKDHPAMFPIEFPKAYIEAMSNESDFIAEPFSGSGTTLMACEQLNRKCRAMEIAPEYVAVALERWATATGKTPVMVTEVTE
jgi:hypothetical protein